MVLFCYLTDQRGTSLPKKKKKFKCMCVRDLAEYREFKKKHNSLSLSLCGQDVPAIATVLQSCLSDVVEWTHLNHMSLNPSKTKYMTLTTHQK